MCGKEQNLNFTTGKAQLDACRLIGHALEFYCQSQKLEVTNKNKKKNGTVL